MIRRGTRKAAARGAFTLMEVLVVVAILVVLAGSATVVYFQFFAEAKEDIARTKCHELAGVVQKYNLRHQGDPAQNLQTLVEAKLVEPQGIIDPWGKPYMMDASGQHHNGVKPDVWSTGPDGSQMIGNW